MEGMRKAKKGKAEKVVLSEDCCEKKS